MRRLTLCLPLLFAGLPAPLRADGRPPGGAGSLWTELPGRGEPAPSAPPPFVRLARLLGPAVVNVSAVQGDERELAPTLGHPRVRSQGTGFLIHKSGYVLTNHHVVENAEAIKVRLADERELPARLVGSDERTDIALLQIDAAGELPVAPLGDSDRIEIGEWVIAIGNPFGLDHTVTAGIVSGKGRRDVRPAPGQGPAASSSFYDFIQTDASINAGNSGGPLINGRGEVVGMNTAMNAEAQGIAFAIPINMVKAIVPLLKERGRAVRAWLGVQPQAVTPSLEHAFGLPDGRGALVAEVAPASPAEACGIRPGDVVLDFDGQPLRRADDLRWLVAMGGEGRSVALRLRRGRALVDVRATLRADPQDAASPSRPPPARGHESPLGMSVSEITPPMARELGQKDLHGVVVVQVEPMSPAAEAGLERGDVVLRVGETPVVRLEDYGAAVRAVKRGGMIRLLARRLGHDFWAAFERR